MCFFNDFFLKLDKTLYKNTYINENKMIYSREIFHNIVCRAVGNMTSKNGSTGETCTKIYTSFIT